MYSRKSIGPRIEPSGTPVLTGYSCEGFIQTHPKPSIIKKEEIRPNI